MSDSLHFLVVLRAFERPEEAMVSLDESRRNPCYMGGSGLVELPEGAFDDPLTPGRQPLRRFVYQVVYGPFHSVHDRLAAWEDGARWRLIGPPEYIRFGIVPELVESRLAAVVHYRAPGTIADFADPPIAVRSEQKFGSCSRCGRSDVLIGPDGILTIHDRPSGVACTHEGRFSR